MRDKILDFFRTHPNTLNTFWKTLHVFFAAFGSLVPVRDKTMLITSFAGRKYDDSPKALYEEILTREEFDDWDIIWAFVDPSRFNIPRGRKIRIDTIPFFMALLYSRVWISNSGMDRNIEINKKKTIKIETWHGTPLKKIGIDQNSGVLGNYKPPAKIDTETIRCAQSGFDREIFARIFAASPESFLMCDLPRNDALLKYTDKDIEAVKKNLGIDPGKIVILYMPTYREYLVNENNQTYLTPPINTEKWTKKLGRDYVVLIRAHYAVSAALDIKTDGSFIDVSDYPYINDLYSAADLMVSDYSSSFFDYAITGKPMLCFAYDLEEYSEKRGLYLDLEKNLPCPVCRDEDRLIEEIRMLDREAACNRTRAFRERFAPFAGNASKAVVDELIRRLGGRR